MTPIIENVIAPNRTVRFRMFGSLANRRCQRRWLMMTTEAGRVLVRSSSVGRRPSNGLAPSRGKRPGVNSAPPIRSAGEPLFRAEVTLIDQRRFYCVERAGALLPRQIVWKRGVGLPATLHVDRARIVSWPASGKGSGLSRAEFRTENTAALAPIPSASETAATTAKPASFAAFAGRRRRPA